VDEEQKFGVNVRQIKTIAANVDTLTLTATLFLEHYSFR
jgi:transcription-repair coupling factor (superfamily II helicase)